ncbi:protein shisa-5 [Brachyhypopomus gauderio]|uniref:protein shisa-5 n=1 Tax=Brachyhypopomus gauderio TaxID=698409 RepID=UPI0040418BB3
MASALLVLLVLSGSLFLTAVADGCDSYMTKSGIFKPSQTCAFYEFCCGSCDNRRCCSDFFNKLDEDNCFFNPEMKSVTIASVIVTVVIFIILVITCCVCPCCCLYKMCRKPRPVMATHTTTVISSQYPQQQTAVPGGQYPPYQSVPAQPGFSAQPGHGHPAAPYPYQGQPYAPGPPPPYNESVGPRYPVPYSQAAYDGGQPPYPLQPPLQQGYAQPAPADYGAAQPPFNPSYVEPPKTGY